MEFVAQSLADAFDAGEFVFFCECDDFAVEVSHGLRALAVGAEFEGVFALELEQEGDFFEHFGKVFAGPGKKVDYFIRKSATTIRWSLWRVVTARQRTAVR